MNNLYYQIPSDGKVGNWFRKVMRIVQEYRNDNLYWINIDMYDADQYTTSPKR